MANSKQPTPAEQAKIEKVPVKLKHRHEHANEWHEPGETIHVWPDQAERIRDHEARLDAGAAEAKQTDKATD